MMKKRIFSSCTLFLVVGFAVALTSASAQETPGIEGVWFAHVTPVDCKSVMPNGAPTFRGLYMFGHDGSLTNEAAFLVPNTPPRSSGVGAWQHTQGHMYTAAFRFFRYSATDGSFVAMRKVSTTIVLNDDQFTSVDMFQDFDKDNMPISTVGSSGCNTVTATRLQ